MDEMNGANLSISALGIRLEDLQHYLSEEDEEEAQKLSLSLRSMVAKLEKRHLEVLEAEAVVDPVIEQYVTPRVDHVDDIAARDVELDESIEEKYKMAKLFAEIGKKDEDMAGIFDSAWVMQHFSELLQVRRYGLMKTCSAGDATDFRFEPLIYEGKEYCEYDDGEIEVIDCSDDSLITTLTGHTDTVYDLKIRDGKLYSSSYDHTIKIWDCSNDTLIGTLTGHTDVVCYLEFHDGKLYLSLIHI